MKPLPGDPGYVSRKLPPDEEARMQQLIDQALAERATMKLPDGVAVLIETDEHDPGGHDFGSDALNAEYTENFNTGELTCYSVSLVHVTDEGEVSGVTKFSGVFLPDYLSSLSGVDVTTGSAEGLYLTLESVPDAYLRGVAEDLIEELP